jgi:hypothetical protein
MSNVRAILRCVHPLLLVSVALFVLLTVALPPDVGLFSHEHGPCSVAPVFILFLYGPVLFCGLLGLGFSGIRMFIMKSTKHKDDAPGERAGGDGPMTILPHHER